MSKQPRESVEELSSSIGTSRPHFTDPLTALVDFVQEADQILDISIRGIQIIRGMPEAAQLLVRVRAVDDADERLAGVERRARLAEQEMENDFPLLHAHTVVAIWSALEASIPKFAAGWLTEKPATLARPAFERIKISVRFYEQMTMDARMAYIVDAVLQEQRAGQPGVVRYEGLLDALGLGRQIPDELRRDLLEMSQVRNLIVHQFGIVDPRFAAACPWLDAHPGSRFNVTHRDYCRYRDAVLQYVTEIAERVTKAT